MDFNSTVDLIIRELNEARDIIDDLRNYPGVPVIQVELAKSKCKSAAEVIALLKNMQANYSSVIKKTSDTIAEEKQTNPAVKPEPAANQPAEPQPASVKRERRATPEKKMPESSIIADTFSHLPNSLNEKLSSMRDDDDDVREILKSKPITNLSDAIGVNDKFHFIREIFMGNREAYEKAVSKLNNATNIEDARAIINTYTGNNEQSEAAKQLLDLVKRKFPGDE